MLADFVKVIAGLAKASNGIEVVEHKGLRKVFVRRGEMGHTEFDEPPPDRNHKPAGLADLMRMARDEVIAPAPEVYHDDSAVVLVLDRGERRQAARMPLLYTQRFRTLAELRSGKSYDVRTAVKLLRFELHGTGVHDVIAALSTIDFARKGIGGQSVGHGRESLGKAVEAVVQQADKVPETFKVRTPVYSNPGCRSFLVDVQVGIYLDMQNETIELRTMADEIESALVKVQDEIHFALEEALPTVPVFHGTP